MVGRGGSGGGGKRGLLPVLSRQVLSVSSWFRIPEQGMKGFEPLSRGTAFCIQPPPSRPSAASASGSSSRRRRSRIIVTCSHVVAPYRWTEHFREPWLEFVKDAHIECRLQLWRDGGLGLSEERRVHAPLHFHPTLDLCAFAYADEGDDAIIGGTDPLRCRDVASQEEALQEGEPLAFLGFPISSSESPAPTSPAAASAAAAAPPTLDVQSLRHVRGKALAPHVVDREGRRYARTEERLAVGMSGGPVLDGRGRCVGLFQGILPPPRTPGDEGDGGDDEEEIEAVLRPLQAEAWELHAAFVPMAPVLKFVKERGLFGSRPAAAAAAAAAK